MPLRPPKTPRLSAGASQRGTGGIHMPFKSPLRPRNTADDINVTPVSKPGKSVKSEASPRVVPCSPTASLKVAQHSQNESPAKENDETQEEKARQLDRKIEELKLRICDLRGIKDVSELDIEADLKRWREVLHEYNEVKDACQFLLGQLAHIKMTTVKDLYRYFGLDVND